MQPSTELIRTSTPGGESDVQPVKRKSAGLAKYETPDDMADKCEEYFRSCEETYRYDRDGALLYNRWGEPMVKQVPPTLSGLCVYLGASSTQALRSWYENHKEFRDVIDWARTRIEAYAEQRLYDRDGQRGAEFVLKTKYGWRELKDDTPDANGMLPALLEYLAMPKQVEVKTVHSDAVDVDFDTVNDDAG